MTNVTDLTQASVLAHLLSAQLGLSSALAIALSVVSQATLAITYPGKVFDALGVPWWSLVLLGMIMTGSAALAALLASAAVGRGDVEPLV